MSLLKTGKLKKKYKLKKAQFYKLRGFLKYSFKERSNTSKFLWKNQSNLFFILSSGRSGTQIISKLFNYNNNSLVLHEPNFYDDIGVLNQSRENSEFGSGYWSSFRNYEVGRRWIHSEKKFYGEVTGTIRYHAKSIKKIFPQCHIFLLSRDLKGIVRSVFGMPFYKKGSVGAYSIEPSPRDRFYSDWENFNRFEKICWSVQETYSFLTSCIPSQYWLKLEELTTNYGYAKEKTSMVFEEFISRDEWFNIVSTPSPNKTIRYSMGEFDSWSERQKESFIRICGDTSLKLGYEI